MGYQYPKGTEGLWMARYRSEPDVGDESGPSVKLDGTFMEAAAQAQKIAVEEGWLFQSLSRRY